jgi:hypothetical protein
MPTAKKETTQNMRKENENEKETLHDRTTSINKLLTKLIYRRHPLIQFLLLLNLIWKIFLEESYQRGIYRCYI